MTVVMGLGLFFYILLGFRYSLYKGQDVQPLGDVCGSDTLEPGQSKKVKRSHSTCGVTRSITSLSNPSPDAKADIPCWHDALLFLCD